MMRLLVLPELKQRGANTFERISIGHEGGLVLIHGEEVPLPSTVRHIVLQRRLAGDVYCLLATHDRLDEGLVGHGPNVEDALRSALA